MNEFKFDKLVEARANENAQRKILKFKETFFKSVAELTGHNEQCYQNQRGPHTRQILEVLLSDNINKGWPKILWDKERVLVAEEIIGMMQPMEKALMSLRRVPLDTDAEPEGEPNA